MSVIPRNSLSSALLQDGLFHLLLSLRIVKWPTEDERIMPCRNVTQSYAGQALRFSAATFPIYLLFSLAVFAVFALCMYMLSQRFRHRRLDAFVDFVWSVIVIEAGCSVLQMIDCLFINPELRDHLLYTRRVMISIVGKHHC
jgi:hypothetical protein